MAFESLTDRLAGVFKKLRGHGKLSEADIKAAMREVRMALLEADVNYKVAKDFFKCDISNNFFILKSSLIKILHTLF